MTEYIILGLGVVASLLGAAVMFVFNALWSMQDRLVRLETKVDILIAREKAS